MKFKKITSLFCAGALMFGITAAPVGQASAYTVEVKESGDGVPVMPPEVAARYSEHRNHFYSLEDWANDETFFDYVLIMPGDTFEIPVYETSGGTIHFVGSMASDDSGNITNDPFFFIDVEGDDNWSTLPSDIYLPDGFEITGSVDPIPERTYSRAFHSSSGTFSVTFCEKWVNNTNCPFYLIYKGSGSGGLGDKNNQAHLLPQIMFYAPYYNITYPLADENYNNNGLENYFWSQGDFDDLEFPKYYWITDVPYHITFPNPVQARYNFDYWGSDEATQTNNGQYTDMTVCFSYGKNSYGNNYSAATFKGYGDAKVNPIFKSGTTITFKGNGGTIKGRDEWIIETPEYDGESGSYGYDLDDYAPVKNGDTFLGWCEKENTRYDSLVTKDDEAAIYNKFWSTEYDRNYKNTNVVLYAKWASDTKEDLEKNGWDIDDDGTLWLLNNNGVEAWNAARYADPTLAPKVKGVKQSYKKIDNNDFAYSLEGVFTGCVNLEDLVFEENVRWLSWSAFKDCTKLKTITFLDSIYNNLDSPMREAPKNVLVTVPETYTGRLVNFTYLTNDEERYGLTVNGELMTESHLTVQCGEGTATFDPTTSTLTLENAELTKTLTPHWLSIYSDPETYTQYYDAAIVSDLPVLNVVLKGKNTVARGSLEAFRAYGDLNITGDGTIEAYYTLSNYFIIDSETGEQVPVTATFPMTITALGNVTLDGITAQRMNVQPAGNLAIKDSTLFGGVFTNNADLTITNSTLKQFTGGVSGSYDSGKDYTPTVGGKNMTIRNTTFDYVTVTAPEGCEKITFKDSTIQLSGKMTADENSKLTIDNTIFKAYGQSDGVTNISENNITLIDCEIKQGAWTQKGYFSIGELSPVVTYSISSDVKKWSNKTDSETPLKVTVNRSSSDNNNNYSSQTFRVLLDDNVVQKTNFTFKANGSKLDIMVNSSVVNELSVGSHAIKVVLSDGEASYSFNVYQPADQSTDTSTDKDKITDSDKSTDTKPTDSDKSTDTKTTDSDKKTDTKATDSDKKTDTKPTDSDKKTDTKTTDSDKKTDTKTTDSDKKTDTSTDTTGNKTTDTSKTTDTNSDTKTDTSTDDGGNEGSDTSEPSDTNSDVKTDTSTEDGGKEGTDTDSEPEIFTSGDYEYQLTEDGTAAITAYNGTETEVNVPAVLDNHPVTWIRLHVFSDNKDITSVTIPEGVTQVGHEVFKGCSALTNVSFPNSLKVLGSGVFTDCTSITEVTVPDSVEEMGIGMFRGCSSLKKVTLPNYGVSPYMYSGCTSLEYAPLEAADNDEMSVIPHCVFEDCTSLKEVTIPENTQKIFQGAFRNCTNLEKVVFPGNTEIIDGTEEGDYPVFDNCPKLTFYGHKGSNSESYAKEHNIPFVELDAKEESPDVPKPTDDKQDDKKDDKKDETQKFGDFEYTVKEDGTVEITKYTGSDENVEIPSEIGGKKVTSLGQGSFSGNNTVKQITIPATVDQLQSYLFAGCGSLNNVTLLNPEAKIDKDAFSDENGGKLDITIQGEEGSTAEQFAKDNELKYEPIKNEPENPGTYGDIDGDGEITANDALTALRSSVGMSELTDEQTAAADVDKDGEVTANDALAVLRHSVGMSGSDNIGKPISA